MNLQFKNKFYIIVLLSYWLLLWNNQFNSVNNQLIYPRFQTEKFWNFTTWWNQQLNLADPSLADQLDTPLPSLIIDLGRVPLSYGLLQVVGEEGERERDRVEERGEERGQWFGLCCSSSIGGYGARWWTTAASPSPSRSK